MSGRTIVVGDIHGCYDELVALLEKAALDPGDRVVSVGDLIVKGEKNRDGIPWYDLYDEDKIVLFGHWPAPAPRRGPHAIGLDTGCVYGFQLTAYVIETGEFLSVEARRAYEAPKRRVA